MAKDQQQGKAASGQWHGLPRFALRIVDRSPTRTMHPHFLAGIFNLSLEEALPLADTLYRQGTIEHGRYSSEVAEIKSGQFCAKADRINLPVQLIMVPVP